MCPKSFTHASRAMPHERQQTRGVTSPEIRWLYGASGAIYFLAHAGSCCDVPRIADFKISTTRSKGPRQAQSTLEVEPANCVIPICSSATSMGAAPAPALTRCGEARGGQRCRVRARLRARARLRLTLSEPCRWLNSWCGALRPKACAYLGQGQRQKCQGQGQDYSSA